MKLASYKDGSRDGQLVVVSRDLASAHYATGIASRLQQAVDDWNFIAPQLQDLSDALNAGRARHAFPFDAAQCMAPLPRAHQRVVGAAYPSRLELYRPAGAAEPAMPADDEPRMVQASSAPLLGACDDIVAVDEAHGIDFGAGLAVVTGDVPQGATREQGLDAVRLILLANDLRLRHLRGTPPGVCDDSLHSRLPAAFGAVAVTPDELAGAWKDGRVDLAVQVSCNGRKVGLCEAGPEMHFDFGRLVAHAARTRPLSAGTLVGGGPIGNAGVIQGKRRDWPKGYACIADKRAMETLQDGAPATDYLKFGDVVRIEVKGRDGRSVFDAIEQKVVKQGASA